MIRILYFPAAKLALALAVAAPVAIAANAPIRDPFFDILSLILLNAIVTGAPEPDMWKTMDFWEFMYLWFYRSSHGFLGSATAYFAHKNMWKDISGPAKQKPKDEGSLV